MVSGELSEAGPAGHSRGMRQTFNESRALSEVRATGISRGVRPISNEDSRGEMSQSGGELKRVLAKTTRTPHASIRETHGKDFGMLQVPSPSYLSPHNFLHITTP